MIPLTERGKLPERIPLFRGHTATVLDTDWFVCVVNTMYTEAYRLIGVLSTIPLSRLVPMMGRFATLTH